jgi:hypothetical protein
MMRIFINGLEEFEKTLIVSVLTNLKHYWLGFDNLDALVTMYKN